nr:CDP-alcohol phosphatidyltransferase family protein [Ardenticatena sp.]
MFDEPLRRWKDARLMPLARRIPCSPPTITLIGWGAGMMAVVLAWHGAIGWACLAWLANRALDALDGAVARAHARMSDLGGYVDILADFSIYALLPLALTVAYPSPQAWRALAWLLTSFYLNTASWMYLAGVLEKRAARQVGTTSLVMPPGLIGGLETFGFFTLFLLLPDALVPLYWLMTSLVLATIVQRLRWAIRNLR